MSTSSKSANRSHRGDAVVTDVLEATREELARVGYRALRIEDVARRANVNRTTIYRRWPTKPDLVRETLRMMFNPVDEAPDTGSLRGDMLVVAAAIRAFLDSPNGRVLVRVVMAEGADSELRGLTRELRAEKEATIAPIVERARARGEAREDVSMAVFLSTLVGGMQHRIFALGVEPSAIDLEQHVDLLLNGVIARS